LREAPRTQRDILPFERLAEARASRYARLKQARRGENVSFLDIYLIVMAVALIGLLIAKFRG
jgi:hypothetical protein